MDNRRKDEKAVEMYEAYCAGSSLAEVGKLFGVTRQSVHSLFKTRGLELREKQAPKEFVLFNGDKYTVRNHGYLGKTKGNRSLMHRDVWEFHNGQIPDGWDVHHRDENKLNNNIENLECLPKAEHTRLYSPHNNQYTKGRKRGEQRCGA